MNDHPLARSLSDSDDEHPLHPACRPNDQARTAYGSFAEVPGNVDLLCVFI